MGAETGRSIALSAVSLSTMPLDNGRSAALTNRSGPLQDWNMGRVVGLNCRRNGARAAP